MPKENTTVYIILGLLSHEDLSGYDIKKRIDHQISFFWDVGYGQIYPTLSRLVADRLVTKRTSESSGGPEKNLYSITHQGREVLKEWLKTPVQKEYTKYEILVKLFFGHAVSFEENRERIEAFKVRQLETLKLMDMFKRNLEEVMDREEEHLFYYLTVLFGEKIFQAYVQWADEAVNLLEARYQKE